MKNIYEIPFGYRVLIKRPGIKFDCFIKFGKVGMGSTPSQTKAMALQRAIAERDRFLDLHGRSFSGQSVRSNTGVAGVSEVAKWFHGQPVDCFQVTAGHPRNGIRRFVYRGFSEREASLRRAITHRARMTGEDAAQLFNQAREAMCL